MKLKTINEIEENLGIILEEITDSSKLQIQVVGFDEKDEVLKRPEIIDIDKYIQEQNKLKENGLYATALDNAINFSNVLREREIELRHATDKIIALITQLQTIMDRESVSSIRKQPQKKTTKKEDSKKKEKVEESPQKKESEKEVEESETESEEENLTEAEKEYLEFEGSN